MNLKDKIASNSKRKIVPVNVAEWADAGQEFLTVYVRSMSAKERMSFEKEIGKNDGLLGARIVCLTLCDDAGELVYSYPDDVEVVNELDSIAMMTVFYASSKLNKLEAKDIEDLKKV